MATYVYLRIVKITFVEMSGGNRENAREGGINWVL
jgi:hypothetical protein